MKTETIKRSEVPKNFRCVTEIDRKYNAIIDDLEELKRNEVLKINCGDDKPLSIYCGLRSKLIKQGIFKQFTSMRLGKVLYITKI